MVRRKNAEGRKPNGHLPAPASARTEPTVRVIHGSSEDLGAVAEGTVTLTVTSPPYWNAIDYDRHAEDSSKWYRTRSYKEGFTAYGEYLDWVVRIFGGVLARTRDGGFCAVVIGTCLLDGRHYPVPFDLTRRMQDVGWEFHQDFVWHKVTGGVKRAGVFIQKPYPGYFYPNIMTEYVLVFRKPGPPLFRGPTDADRKAAAVPIDRLFTMDMAHNVWHIAPVPPGHLEHPCPFPEELPWRLIRLYSYPGDLVLDPFCGSGQTLKVARYTGRSAIGYDTVEKYVEYARRRSAEPPALREQQLIARFDKVALDAARTGPTPRNGTRRGKARARSNGHDATLFALEGPA